MVRMLSTSVRRKGLVFLVVAVTCGYVAAWTDRPVIGVLAQETTSPEGDTFIPASYVKFLNEGGARVVPILANQSQAYYTNLFNSINGALFPGGSVGTYKTHYAVSAQYIYDLAIQANDKGDVFPIWGTCMGFQMLLNLTAGENLLNATDSFNLPLPLEFTPAASTSKMLSYLDRLTYYVLTHMNITSNMHHYGIYPERFRASKKLMDFYVYTTVNRDRKGVYFVSTMEGRKYPFFGTQWHPEQNSFLWNPQLDIPHYNSAVKISQYFANFFMDQVRQSSHKFPDLKTEAAAMIENYKRVYSNDGTFGLLYYFNYTAPHPF